MTQAREFADFWLRNSVHADEQFVARRNRKAVQALADKMIRVAMSEWPRGKSGSTPGRGRLEVACSNLQLVRVILQTLCKESTVKQQNIALCNAKEILYHFSNSLQFFDIWRFCGLTVAYGIQ
jgi:hypothetical protein